MRKVGLSTPFEYLNRESFAEYRQAGIGALELSVAAEQYPLLDLERIADDAKAEGIELWSFHLPFYPFDRLNIAALDEELRTRSVEVLAGWIGKAAKAGFRHAVIHASGEPIEDADRPAAMKQAVTSLKELGEAARKAGIILAVEDLPRTCLGNGSEDMRTLLSAHEGLRVCFDTNHLLSEDLGVFLDAVKEKLVTVHVSDYDFVNERHWLPGEGKIDWVRMMDKLDEIGYAGVFMYELGRGSTSTITRECPLTPQMFYRNAVELHERRETTKRGTVKENIGFWN